MADSSSSRFWWLLLAVACQFVWGTYPAAVRYMQTKAPEPMSSLQLSLLINLLACPALLFGSTIPTAISRACAKRKKRKAKRKIKYGIPESAAAAAAAAAAAERPPSPTTPTERGSEGKLLAAAAAGAAAGKGRGKMRMGDSALTEPLLGPGDSAQDEVAVDAEVAAAEGKLGKQAALAGGQAEVDKPSAPPMPATGSPESGAAGGSAAAGSLRGPVLGSPPEKGKQQMPLQPEAGAGGDLEAGVCAPAANAEEQQPLLGGPSHSLPNGTPPHMASCPPEPRHYLEGADEDEEEEQGPSVFRQLRVLSLTTFFLCFLFLCQVFSLLFTTAYLSQMVFLLAPVMVALMARALFKQPLPSGLWPALFMMLLGCGMVIVSKMHAAAPKPKDSSASDALPWPQPRQGGTLLPAAGLEQGHVSLWGERGAEQERLCSAVFGDSYLGRLCAPPTDDADEEEDILEGEAEAGSSHSYWREEEEEEGRQGGGAGVGGSASGGGEGQHLQKKKRLRPKPGGLGKRDAFGIFLSFLGASCLAGFMLVVQRSAGVVSNQQVLWGNFLTQSVLVFCITWKLERGKVYALFHLSLAQVGMVFAMAAGVNWGANLVQQMCIQALGAPQAAAFLPVRLLGSLAASYPLLHEGLVGPMQWGGCAVLLAAVTWYLLQQKKSTERAAAHEAFEADVEAEAGAVAAAAGPARA